MKFFSKMTFRKRIFIGMILAAIVPMLVGYLLTLKSFSVYMDKSLADEAENLLISAENSLDMALSEISVELSSIGSEPVVKESLSDNTAEDNKDVYRVLFSSTGRTGRFAYFSIYGTDGRKIISALNNSYIKNELALDWGVLFGLSIQKDECLVQNARIYNGEERTDYLRMARVILNSEKEVSGYAVATILKSNFDEIFGNLLKNIDGPIYVLDKFREVVYSSDEGFSGDEERLVKRAILSGQTVSEDSNGYVFYIREADSFGTYVVYKQPVKHTNIMGKSIVIIAVISAAVSLMLCLFLSKSFGSMLSVSYNELAENLKKKTDNLILRERELSEVNIKMLQAQLNPHFLYNTLDTMKWLGKTNQVPEVASLSENLAGILRTAISGAPVIPLSQEIELVESYVKIQQIRFEDKFDFLVDAEDGLSECRVPKLMLQPIVENSLIHGLNESDSGTVFIHIEKEVVSVIDGKALFDDISYSGALSDDTASGEVVSREKSRRYFRGRLRQKQEQDNGTEKIPMEVDMLKITIKDDGCGIDRETLLKIREKLSGPASEELHVNEKGRASLGIYNVNSIIKLRYEKNCPVRCGLEIDSEKGAGTTVTLRLPCIYNN